MNKHQHEEWQMRDSARGGRYCAACGDREEEPPTPTIPEAAVEAAMEAFLLESIKRKGELSEKPFALLAALEAAAPHMLRDAWIEGFNVGAEWGEWFAGPATRPEPENSNSNPYGGRA